MSLVAVKWLHRDSSLSAKSVLMCAGTAAIVVALFVAFQLITTPAYRSVGGSVQDSLPIPDPSSAPHIGPEDAEHTVALLYDYQCPHCKTIHGLLEDVVDLLDGQVVFVLCPSPLSPQCNPYIPAEQDRFPGSCAMANSALGLWKHNPEYFEEYDNWLWEEYRTEEECIAKAQQICPDLRESDRWVLEYLSASLEIFARTSMSGRGGIPRLVSADAWAMPEADTAEDLAEIVKDLIYKDPSGL